MHSTYHIVNKEKANVLHSLAQCGLSTARIRTITKSCALSLTS